MADRKILYIHQDGLLTGSLISLYNLLKGIDRSKTEAEIIFLAEGPAIEMFKKEGFQTHVCVAPTLWIAPGPVTFSKAGILNMLSIFPSGKLNTLIRKIQPDLVHVNCEAAAPALLVSKGTLHIPSITHVRATYYATRSGLFKNLSQWMIKKYSDHIIAISENEAVPFPAKKTSIIYNTIAPEEAEQALKDKQYTRNNLNLPSDAFIIGFVGELAERKGAWDFIRLASSLLKARPELNFRFLILGKYDRDRILKEEEGYVHNGKTLTRVGEILDVLIDSENLKRRIHFLGYRKDYLSVMANMHVMTVFSCFGGIGRQPFESFAVGTPAVIGRGRLLTYNMEGKNFVEHAESNDADDMLPAMLRMIERLEKSEISKQEIRSFALENFNPAVNSAKIEAIYDMLLNKFKRESN